MKNVTNFRKHFQSGFSVDALLPVSRQIEVLEQQKPGPIAKVSWTYGGAEYVVDLVDHVGIQTLKVDLLPDSSGFICFERDWKPDNCILLDAYGKERMRLTVPWQMTGAGNDEGATFGNIDGPYPHPRTGKMGEFGINGWVGNHKFYFELDYHTGQFLWCRPIRD